MARLTAANRAWNLPPVCALSRFHPCQYAGEVLGTRCSTHASRTRGSAMAWACAMSASLSSSTPAKASKVSRGFCSATRTGRMRWASPGSRRASSSTMKSNSSRRVARAGPARARTSWRRHWVSVRMSRASPCAWVSACRASASGMASSSSGPRWPARPILWPAASGAARWRPWRGALAWWRDLRTGAGCGTRRRGTACRPRRPSARPASLAPHRRSYSQDRAPAWCRRADACPRCRRRGGAPPPGDSNTSIGHRHRPARAWRPGRSRRAGPHECATGPGRG